jgi:hypothetical protein
LEKANGTSECFTKSFVMPGIRYHAIQYLKKNPGQRFTARDIVDAVLHTAPERDFTEKRDALAIKNPGLRFEQRTLNDRQRRSQGSYA